MALFDGMSRTEIQDLLAHALAAAYSDGNFQFQGNVYRVSRDTVLAALRTTQEGSEDDGRVQGFRRVLGDGALAFTSSLFGEMIFILTLT